MATRKLLQRNEIRRLPSNAVLCLAGGEADYLREGAIHREGGGAFFDISRSRTDMVLVYIGVAFGR